MDIDTLLGPLPDTTNSILANRLRSKLELPRWFVRAFILCRWCAWLAGTFFLVRATVNFRHPAMIVVYVVIFAATVWLFRKWILGWEVRLLWWIWTRAGMPATLGAVFRSWDHLVNSLQNSRHGSWWNGEMVRERDHIYLGVVAGTPWPVLGDIGKLKTIHLHIVGGTGTGKTHRFLVPAAVQLIRRRQVTFVYLDLKGDPAQRNKIALEARRAGLDFRWVTVEAGQSSYIFNPLKQDFFCRLALTAQVQLISQALGLEGSERQDEAFFSDINEKLFQRAYARFRPNSFRELRERLDRPGVSEDLGLTAREWELAAHLRAEMDRLGSSTVLNACQVGPGVSADALKHAIQISDVLSRPQVIYFWLPALLERVTARTVARLVAHQLSAAAKVHRGPRVPVVVVADEAQEVINRAWSPLLKQSRQEQISYWIAHQQLEDLIHGQQNHLAMVTGNVGMQIHFSAADERGREHLVGSSGEVIRHLRGTAVGNDGRISDQEREVLVSRLSREDIVTLNRNPNLAAVLIAPPTPLAPFRHVFFMSTGFCVGPREFARLQRLPWPRPNRFTVVAPLVEESRAMAQGQSSATRSPAPTRTPSVRRVIRDEESQHGVGKEELTRTDKAPTEAGCASRDASDPALEAYLRELKERDEQAGL